MSTGLDIERQKELANNISELVKNYDRQKELLFELLGACVKHIQNMKEPPIPWDYYGKKEWQAARIERRQLIETINKLRGE